MERPVVDGSISFLQQNTILEGHGVTRWMMCPEVHRRTGARYFPGNACHTGFVVKDRADVGLLQIIEKGGKAEDSSGGAKRGLIGQLGLRKIRGDDGKVRAGQAIFCLAKIDFVIVQI